MISGWRKARYSKYKHLYDNGVARCGSPAKPHPEWHWSHTEFARHCPRCLELMTVKVVQPVLHKLDTAG
jgi:hypothetical protein